MVYLFPPRCTSLLQIREKAVKEQNKNRRKGRIITEPEISPKGIPMKPDWGTAKLNMFPDAESRPNFYLLINNFFLTRDLEDSAQLCFYDEQYAGSLLLTIAQYQELKGYNSGSFDIELSPEESWIDSNGYEVLPGRVKKITGLWNV